MSNETNSNAGSEDDLGTGILYVEDIVVYQEPVLATPKTRSDFTLTRVRMVQRLPYRESSSVIHKNRAGDFSPTRSLIILFLTLPQLLT